jgi:hypothetical protein
MPASHLHYSRRKLWRLVAIGLVLTAMFLWVAVDVTLVAGDGNQVAARLARTVGPDALRLLAAASGLITATLLVGNLRLLASADSVAVAADAEAVTIRRMFRTKVYPWADVETLFVRRVSTPARGQAWVMVRPRGRREAGVAVNSLRESTDEAEAWIVAAEQMRPVRHDSPQNM